MVHTLNHPSLPLVAPLYEHLVPHSKIELNGKIDHHSDNFAVEFLSGPNIVLHANFRFHPEHAIVVNTSANGGWGQEVRLANPLHKGDHFHIEIQTHHGHYSITVNGQHVTDFHHRYPIETVQALGVHGNVHLEKVDFQGFPFSHGWSGNQDYGHGGYAGYGTPSYVAPTFNDGHHHGKHFH